MHRSTSAAAKNCASLFCLVSILAATHPAVGEEALTSPFDGKSLAGWTTLDGKPVTQGWEVVDGTIHRAKSKGRAGHIVTVREYGDFQLTFEWKIAPHGNSGLKYRVRSYGGKLLGCEYQIYDDQGAKKGVPPTHSAGALYDLYEPRDAKQVRPAGEFNLARIVVRGDQIEHWLNGQLIVSATVGDDEWRRRIAASKFSDAQGFGGKGRGKIMLTDHGSEVWYRNFVFEPLPETPAEPELMLLTKIWDQGKHNAFTDLIRWRDKWYCTFREADGHVGGDGKLRVLESANGNQWEAVALVAETGIDLRDPKLSVTPDHRLTIVAGGSVYEGKTLKGRQPRITFSADARQWTPPQRVLSEGDWLWRVTWHEGRAYGVAYDASKRSTAAAEEAANAGIAPPGPADWKLKLVASNDGVKYDLITHLDVPGHPSESTVRFLPDDEMIALVRREGGSKLGWIGRSPPPYREWKWKETEHRLGGPNFIRLPDGTLWAAGRAYTGAAKTVLARMTAEGGYMPVLTLSSGGDTSYPGLVWHDDLLWMSYYSSHEGKSSIYLAKIKLSQ